MKKIIILLSGLVVGVGIMAYLYFSRLTTENDTKDLALQSATNNAALIFSFQNDKAFYQIIEGQNLLQQVVGPEKTELLTQLKEKFIDDKTLNYFIKDQQIYISVLPDSANKLNFLLTIQVAEEKTSNQFYNQLKGLSKSVENAEDVHSISLNNKTLIYFRFENNVLTASVSLKLIKDAAIRLKENPFTEYIKENNQFNKNVLAHVYINFNQASLLLKNILAGTVNGELAIFNQQNSFASLNYNFSKERILFNGSTKVKTTDGYLKIFEDLATQNLTIHTILPSTTANYAIYGMNDYPSWLKKLSTWQEQKNEYQEIQKNIQNIKNQYRVDLNTIFPLYVKSQFATFQLSTSEKLGAVALTNGEKVKQLLLDVSTDYSDEIRLFKPSDIPYAYFGEPFENFSRPYYTIIDNNLIIANNASTLQSFLNSYKNNKLLMQTPQYLDALNQISTTSTISYYINTQNSADILRNNILLPYYKHLRADSGLKKFDTFCYQMSADKGKFITNILLNKYIKPEIPDTLSNP